jgi:hypothetical protein
LVGAPIAIVGAISRFSRGNSTHYQRVAILLWLFTGQIFGLFSALGQLSLAKVRDHFRMIGLRSFTKIWSSRHHRTFSLTPALLERLGLDPEKTAPGLYRTFLVAVKIAKSFTFWPYKLLDLSASVPEASFFVIVALATTMYGFASIWGFVVVGQMLVDYGNCFRVY